MYLRGSGCIQQFPGLHYPLAEVRVPDARRAHHIDRATEDPFQALFEAEVCPEVIESRTNVKLDKDVDVAGVGIERARDRRAEQVQATYAQTAAQLPDLGEPPLDYRVHDHLRT